MGVTDGSHIAQRARRVGLLHGVLHTVPGTFTPVLAAHELAEGQRRQVEVEGTPILLARHHGQVYKPRHDILALPRFW